MKQGDHNNFDIEDKLIKELFQEFSPEEAPELLKQTTMNRVFKDWSENPVVYKPIINKTNRIWVVGGLVALLALTFLMDATVLLEYWNDLDINATYLDVGAINKGLSSLSHTIQNLPSILYFVGIGLVFILGIDRLFNRLAKV